jgi:predicted transport protein
VESNKIIKKGEKKMKKYFNFVLIALCFIIISCSPSTTMKEEALNNLKPKLDNFIGANIETVYLLFGSTKYSIIENKVKEKLIEQYITFSFEETKCLCRSLKCFDSTDIGKICINTNYIQAITFKVTSYGIILAYSISER